MFLALAVAVAVVWMLTAHHVPGGPPPAGMIGSWITGNPRYADRYIEIRPDTMTFGTGGVASRTYKILGCEEVESAKGKTLYTLHVADAAGTVFNRPLYLDGLHHLQFKNQPNIVWTRSP